MKGPKRTKGWDDSAAGRTPRRAEPGPLYQALFDISGDVLMVVEDDTTISMVNHRFEEMTGYGRDDVVGKMSSLALVPEEERERVREIHRMRREDPQSVPLRHSHWMQGKGGRKWLAEITGTLIPGTRRSLLDLRDITEAHTLQQELLRRNEELAALVAVTREMVSSLELQDVLDRTLAIVCGQIGAIYGFLSMFDEAKSELTATAFWGERVLPPGRTWKVGEGVVGWVAQSWQPILCDDIASDPRIRNSLGPSLGYHSIMAAPLKVREKLLGVVSAVAKETGSFTEAHLHLLSAYAAQASLALENALLYEEVKNQASTDGLTGLHNRRSFDLHLESELNRAQRYGHPLSLLFLDVDELKAVNDRYGHLQGDQLLRHLASLLTGVLRKSDVAARFGGDEFVVLLPETTGEEAAAVTERLLGEVTPCPLLSGGSITWAMSLGVAWLPLDGDYGLDLLRLADEAAYRAKREGIGWAFATPG